MLRVSLLIVSDRGHTAETEDMRTNCKKVEHDLERLWGPSLIAFSGVVPSYVTEKIQSGTRPSHNVGI